MTYRVLVFRLTLRVLLSDLGHDRISNHVTSVGYDIFVGTVEHLGQRVWKNKIRQCFEESGRYLPAGARFFFPLGRDVAGGSSVPLTRAAASVCLATIDTAFRNSGELIVIPGTNEKGSRRTGKEEARASVKRNR
jgi:hypothetical protein